MSTNAPLNCFAELHADGVFHVYNRTNNKELLFKNDDDRRFFLSRYRTFISPFAETYAFCLLPNHFHFMIRVKSLEAIAVLLEKLKLKDRTKAQIAFLNCEPESRTAYKVMENQFLRLFTSYAVVFNDRHDRQGNLFNRPFKRIEVGHEGYFTYLVYYIHANPKKHGIMADFTRYYWSSYRAYLSKSPTLILREEVLEWFGGLDAFVQFHLGDEDMDKISRLILED